MMSLSMLWGLINGLQIVAYLMLFNIPIPGNVLVLNKIFYEIATFDIIEVDWLEEYFDGLVGELDENKDVYLSDSAREQGYDRTNPFNNLILEILLVVIAIAFLLLLKIMSCCGSIIKKCYMRVKEHMCWNAAIRMMSEEYITVSLACMIKVYAYNFSNFYEAFSSTFAMCMLLALAMFPFLVTRWLWKLHAQSFLILSEKEFTKKYGSLTLDLYARNKGALAFNFVFMVRRLFLVFIIVGLPKWSYFQVQVITNFNTFALIY